MFPERTHGRPTKFRPLRALLWLLGLPFRATHWIFRLLRPPVGKFHEKITNSFPEFPRELQRPAVFTLMFWSAFALTFALWPFLAASGGGFVIPTLVVIAAIFLLWRFLPWNPGAGATRKLAAPAFVIAAFLLDRTITGAGMMFYPIAFASGVFLFGFRRGIGYALAVLAVLFVDTMLIVRVFDDSASISSVIGNALITTFLFGLIAVFVIGVCTSIIESVQRREESEDLLSKLETAHADLKEYTGKVRELTVSSERARMAREMHDSVGHYLTVVNVQLEAANKFMDAGSPDDIDKARTELRKAKRLASEALSEVRRSVRALKPLAMEDGKPTSESLRGLVRTFADNGPSVSVSVLGRERNLPPDTEVALYRTLQECLTNVLKHSRAEVVQATLVFYPDSVRLSVVDDGEGAPPDMDKGGFGLEALSERAVELGGTLSVGNAPDGGFIVEVVLPARSR